MASDQAQSNGESRTPVFDKVGENLYRHRSSRTYYALLKRADKQFRRSLKTQDRALALRRLAELRGKIGALSTSEDSRLPWVKIAAKWLDTVRHTMKPSSIQRRQCCIDNMVPYFNDTPIRNLKPADCDAWLQGRGTTISASSFAHELGTLNLVFGFAVKRGLLLSNPASHIERKPFEKNEMQVPSREQFKKLIAAMRDANGTFGSQGKGSDAADFVELLAYSGCRQAEASALRWCEANFNEGVLTINGTKSKSSERQIPMTGALSELLGRLKAGRHPKQGDFISQIKDAKKSLATTCRKLGLPHFTHHDFRHFFATTCIESGVDIPTVSRWLGHKDGGALAMRVYGHLRVQHSTEMAKRVSFG